MPRTLSRRRQALILAGALCTGCSAVQDASPALVLEQLDSPTEQPASAPQLATSDTRAVLSWLERSDDGRTLFMAERLGDSWSVPRPVATGETLLDNSADVPSVYLLGPNRLAAQWLQRNGPSPDAYSLLLAFSDDDGVTWSTPVRPHQDDTATQHGFASLFSLPDHGLGVVWLDGRATETTLAENALGDMALWSATFDAHGVQTDEMPLDPRVCDCCQTSAAITSDAVIVAYRDRSPREVRDIVVTRLVDNSWTPPVLVHDDNWTISGCPVNGPAIDARGEDVVVAWFTGTTGFGQVFAAFSRDGGRTFEVPIQVDDGRPRGRVSVVIDAEGAFVAWTEALGGRSEFRVRRVPVEGSPSESLVVGDVDSSQYPRMAAFGPELLFVWLSRDDGSTRLRTARGTRRP